METLVNNYEENIDHIIEQSMEYHNNDFTPVDSELLSHEDLNVNFLDNFYRKLGEDYEYIAFFKNNNSCFKSCSDEEKGKILSLVSWVIKTLINWKHEGRVSSNELSVLFNITSFLDKNGILWKKLLSHNVCISNEIFEYSKNELFCLRGEFKIAEEADAPIHERESLERFLLAISNKNWKEISELWRIFNTRPLLGYRHIQMLYILDYFNPDFLISSFEKSDSVPVLMSIMHYVRVETAFFVGSKTSNDYLEFSSVYSTLTTAKTGLNLTENENGYLTTIFNKVGSDTRKFSSWMSVFNNPVFRFPKIQVALGKMLANVSNKEIIEIYIKSVSLNNSSNDEDRKIVTECLKEIINCCDPTRRKEIWDIAYQVWDDWNFGGIKNRNYIFRVSYTELDFAVVGYIRECLSDDERLERKNSILKNLQLFESKWHYSSSDAKTYWYRNLSLYQVFEHADRTEEDINTWLLFGSYYVPSIFHENEYNAMLIGWN